MAELLKTNSEAMNEQSNRNNRIAKNTVMLYFRMLLLMGVSLYTSRVVLETLGIEDYGVYNVVSGFVTMFAFLNGAMSTSTLRYITFALGRGDAENLKQVFSSCILTHAVIALIVFILAETIGLWFVLNKLVIPENQMTAAMVVYQCSILTTIFTILSFPFNADIIAHEHMSAFAYISIFEALAKLGVVYLLLVIASVNKLMLYAFLLLAVNLVVIVIYNIYCRRYFIEAKIRFYYKKELFKELFSFTGWTLIECMGVAFCGQGLNILLNMFFGPVLNAAQGIAVQIQSAVKQFANSFQSAVNPQITKTYASRETEAMFSLVNRSSKFTFLLLMVVALPLCFEIDWILSIWLVDVPEYTSIFARIIIVTTVVDCMANPMIVAINATGRIKMYQLIVGTITILTLPLAYLALKLGFEPYSVLMVQLSIIIVAFVVRLEILRRLTQFSISDYVRFVLTRCLLVLIGAMTGCWIVNKCFSANTFITHLITLVIFFAISAIASFCLGLSARERNFISEKFLALKSKIFK